VCLLNVGLEDSREGEASFPVIGWAERGEKLGARSAHQKKGGKEERESERERRGF